MKKLNNKQRVALDMVLRTLDARNDYLDGDVVRVAFGVELDGLRWNGRMAELTDHGLTKSGHYYHKGLLNKLLKQLRKKKS